MNMFKQTKKVICFLSLFLITASGIFAAESAEDVLAGARKKEEAGNIADALQMYKSWIRKNPGEKDALPVLKHIIEIDDDCSRLVLFLSELETDIKTGGIENTDLKTEIARAIAYSGELLGALTSAGKSYSYIFNSDKTDSRYSSLLSAAQILCQQGLFDQSKEAIRIILKHAKDNEVLAKAGILLAFIYVSEEKQNEAKSVYVSLFNNHKKSVIYPVILAGYCEFLVLQDNIDEGKKVLDVLEKYFPSSPEYFLAKQLITDKKEGRITYYPSPLFFLNGKEGEGESVSVSEDTAEKDTKNGITYIQTGSFIDRENAEYMVAELTKKNFRTMISEKKIKETIFYRVFVSINSIKSDEINNLLLQLKEAGFEGFIATP